MRNLARADLAGLLVKGKDEISLWASSDSIKCSCATASAGQRRCTRSAWVPSRAGAPATANRLNAAKVWEGLLAARQKGEESRSPEGRDKQGGGRYRGGGQRAGEKDCLTAAQALSAVGHTNTDIVRALMASRAAGEGCPGPPFQGLACLGDHGPLVSAAL